MEYVTHLRPDGTYQSLREHEEQVAALAGSFAGEFGAEEHARRTGLLHDIGKYSANGQRRQRDPEHLPWQGIMADCRMGEKNQTMEAEHFGRESINI